MSGGGRGWLFEKNSKKFVVTIEEQHTECPWGNVPLTQHLKPTINNEETTGLQTPVRVCCCLCSALCICEFVFTHWFRCLHVYLYYISHWCVRSDSWSQPLGCSSPTCSILLHTFLYLIHLWCFFFNFIMPSWCIIYVCPYLSPLIAWTLPC